MPEITPVELVYEGEEVKDGSVPLEYMIDALVGFSGAYSKIARRTPGVDHEPQLRVVGLKPNSTHIFVDIIEFVKANPAASGVLVSGGSVLLGGAYKVIKDIAVVFTAKKELKGEPLKDSNIVIKGSQVYIDQRSQLALTKEQLEYLRSALIDAEMDKMTAPLEDQKIEKFQLKNDQQPLAEASRKDRPYFASSRRAITTTRDDVTLEGSLNSLTKDKKRGTFYTLGGKHIPYQFLGSDEKQLLDAFTHPGIVKARGKVSFDGNLEPTQILIAEILLEQPRIF
jgi:hypothetical protein